MTSQYLSELDEEILALDARRRIYNVVTKSAGSHFREIERKCKMSVGQVKYHLSYLTRRGLLKEDKSDGHLRYFPREMSVEQKRIMSILRQQKLREIILHILMHPNCNHESIVRAVKLSPSTISWHLRKMEANNIIVSKRVGRKTIIFSAIKKEIVLSLLITYQESFLDELVDRVIDMWS